MAGKKKGEIALQREIETQEEWEEVMSMEGLWVIDVYQEWCGPCQALVGNFRRLKNELGDPLLHYAIAKADTIDGLEKYRGRCEPTFLFFAGGILTSFIHGANAPKLQRIITEQLAQEHKVMDGSGERKEVKDTFITRLEEKAMEKAEAEEAAREAEDGEGSYTSARRAEDDDGGLEALREEFYMASKELPVLDESLSKSEKEVPKGVTIAIIKPNAVAQGKVDEIIQEITNSGLEIIAEEQRELTEDEAMELYSDLKEEPYFNDLIRFITSGPSHLLAITRGNTGETVVTDWRELIGPTEVETAKAEAPDSLRAKYGDSGYMNALHGSSSSETAARELAFFFPNLAVPTYLRKKLNIQRTLALIRPEAFSAKKEEILAKISEAGFKIAMYKEVQLNRDQVNDFYKEHEGQAYFDQLVEHMTSGPVLALGLAGDEAITAWRDMLGPPNVDEATESSPQSLRAKYTGPSGINQFHGSDSEENAKKELNMFFPMEETVAVIKPSGMGTKDAIVKRIHEAGFKIAARKETTITRDIAELMYPDHEEKEYYNDLIESMTSGPTMFMVLSREDAIDGWRQEIGETNPDDARVTNPESLRAQYGASMIHNAVHGSSNRDKAKQEMKAVFGDLEFNEDGTVKGEQPELDEATEALKKGRSSPVAETAPEYKQTEDTTADETTDADTTQDVTADTTQNVTADTTEGGQSEGETTQGNITVLETSQQDTTQAETTTATADETEADTTAGDTTQAEDTTQGDTTAADTTQADETTTAADDEATTTADETATEGQTEAQTESAPAEAATNESAAVEAPAQEESSQSPAAEEKPAEEKAAEEKPAEEKSTEEKSAEEKPAEEIPAEEKSAEEKPAEEKSAEEKPAEEKPAEEKSAEEKPAEAETKGEEKEADEEPTQAQEESETKGEEEISEKPTEGEAAQAEGETKAASPTNDAQEVKGDDDAQSVKGQEEENREDAKGSTTGGGETSETEKPAESS